MSGLVYLFIALCGVGLGAAAYFGLTFSGIEAGLFALIVTLAGLLLLERRLRYRAEARLEKAIDDLARLLSTDANAGQVLSQRVNALTDLELGARLEVMEADVSVLGTVIRQVAEAVSELEADRDGYTLEPRRNEEPKGPPHPSRGEPVIPLALVEQALDDDRLVHHLQPIVTLPQRKTHAYVMIPRLVLEEGELADPPDFMPVRTPAGDRVIRRIERICVEQGVGIVRRARMMGKPVRVFIPMSRASLSDRTAIDGINQLLSANHAVTPDIQLSLAETDWNNLSTGEADMLERLVKEGVGLALTDARSLRRDFADLANRRVTYLGVDATRFLSNPAALTDFHSADIADYAKRFGVQLVMTDVQSEEQILTLLDDSVGLAQGPAIAPPGPIRTELREDDDQMRRAAVR